MANNVDLGQMYGFQCPPGGCAGPTGIINPTVPSLEQIASYHYATLPQKPYDVSALPNLFDGEQYGGVSNVMPQMNGGIPTARYAGLNTIQEFLQSNRSQQTTGSAQPTGSQMQAASDGELTAEEPTPSGGVSEAANVPMTQAQIDAENPDMLRPIQTYSQPFPITAESIQYLNSFMRTQIGRRVKVEFLVGGGSLVERSGYLLSVGANFILLNEVGTSNLLSCDFYNIKFVTFYY